MKKLLLSNLLLALSLSAMAFSPFALQEVKVLGVNPSQEKDILNLLGLKTGQKISENDVSNIVKKLYQTGNFDDAVVSKKDNNLEIKLSLKQVIASLNFKGNSLLPTDQIRKTYEENNIKQGARLNREVLNNLNDEVERFYQSQGYSQVAVTTQYDYLNDGTVNVTVIVDESKKANLKKLVLEGNKSFSQSEILEDSIIRPDQHWYNFYHNSRFDSNNKEELIKNITNFYKSQGYAKFKIVSDNSVTNDPKNPQDVTYHLTIDEGQVYTISKVNFFTRDTNLKESLENFNYIAPGSIYDANKVDYTISRVRDYLSTLGYAQARIEPVLRFNDSKKSLELVIAVDPGKRYTVGKIVFKGNILTKDYVIRRLLEQHENAVYNLNNVNNDISSLMRTGYFDNVDYSVKPIQGTEDQLELTYNLKEANNGNFTVGLGYGDSQGLNFSLKFGQKNLLGTARNLSSELSYSKGRYSANLDFTEPYITTSGLSLNTSLYYNKVDTEKLRNYNGYNYKQEVYGLYLGSGFNVSRYGSLSFGLGFERNYYENLNPEFYRALYLNSIGQEVKNEGAQTKQWTVKTKDISLKLSYNYNTYDRYLFPTSGFDVSLNASYTGIYSTDKYLTTGASFKTYLPLNNSHSFVFSTRASASYSKAFGDKYLPISSLYSIGGYGSLRGLEYGSIGPIAISCGVSPCPTTEYKNFNRVNPADKGFNVIGGDVKVTGGIDLIFPLFRGELGKTVRTYLFVDTAAVWSTQWKKYTSLLENSEELFKDKGYEDFSKPNFRVTAGASVEWRSPLGLLSFSIAKPLVKKSYDSEEIFSINFGGSY